MGPRPKSIDSAPILEGVEDLVKGLEVAWDLHYYTNTQEWDLQLRGYPMVLPHQEYLMAHRQNPLLVVLASTQ